MRKLSSLYPDTGRSSLARFHHVALIPLPSPPIKLTPQLRPEEREKERDRIDMESKAQAFRGVRRRKWGRWVSEIRIPKSRTRIWLGSYDAPEKAARAYDAAVYCLRGEVGKFNFPGERRPNLPEARRRTLTKDDVKAIAANHADLMTPPPPPISPLDEEDDCSLSNLSSNSFLLADAVVIEEMMSMWDIL